MKDEAYLSRRERQIMDIVYKEEEVTVREVWKKIADAPSYSTVRKLMSILEEKGYLYHGEKRRAYYYKAVRKRKTAARGAVKRLVDTYFEGSAQKAMVGLLGMKWKAKDAQKLKRIQKLVDSLE